MVRFIADKRCAVQFGKPSSGMTFMLFDVDRFNSINDTFGHHIGDQTIIEIVRRIEVALPNKAVLAESVT